MGSDLEVLAKDSVGDGRGQTSLRILYEAQAEVIRKQLGGLPKILDDLQLSQRKLAQLLLVDPSALTRWLKSNPPPHVWRALQWYMILNQKIPGLTPEYFLSARLSSQRFRDVEFTRLKDEFKTQLKTQLGDELHEGLKSGVLDPWIEELKKNLAEKEFQNRNLQIQQTQQTEQLETLSLQVRRLRWILLIGGGVLTLTTVFLAGKFL